MKVSALSPKLKTHLTKSLNKCRLCYTCLIIALFVCVYQGVSHLLDSYCLNMPCVYHRKPGFRPYGNFNKDQLRKATDAIKSGKISNRKTSKNVFISFWNTRLHGLHPLKTGVQTRLSAEAEQRLAETVITLAEWKVPVDLFDVGLLVKNNLDRGSF